MPAPPRGPSGERGYLMLLRGQPFSGYSSAKHGPLWNYRLLPGRAGDAGTLLFHFIYDRTWSAWGCPEWTRIALQEFCEYASHKSARAIRFTLKFLVDIHLIERDPKDPWRFKTHPENIAAAPLMIPVRHPNAAAKKRQARAAQMSTPALTAALRNLEQRRDSAGGPKVHEQGPPQPVESGRTEPRGGSDTAHGSIGQTVEFSSTEPILPHSDSQAELKQVSPCCEAQIITLVSARVNPATDG